MGATFQAYEIISLHSRQFLAFLIQHGFFIVSTNPSSNMPSVQSSPDLPSFEHNMALETSSPCHQGLTPPDSPMKGPATPQATVEDLKHLFDVLEKVLFDREPPNTHVFQDHSQPGPDMVQLKQLLVDVIRKGYPLAEPPVSNKPSGPSQSCFSSDEQAEKVQTADGLDLESPICTTPDDFKSFEKWASKSQFKTVMETYEPPATHPSTFQIAGTGLAGTKKHVNTRLPSQRRLAMTWTTTLSMHSLSVNVLVHNTFACRTENLLIV
jgi:hypothetical protein